MNLNFSNLLNEPKDEEEQVIKNLVNEIYLYQTKIENINVKLKKSIDNVHKNIMLKDLNITKEILNLKLTNLNISLNNSKATYAALISKKDSLMIELVKKINTLKEEIVNKDITNFKSLLMVKYILSNNSSVFLKEEQINDIINDNQNMLNKEKDKKYLLINENNIINDILLDICNKENNIKLKIEELKEFLLMLNEEKYSTNKELINLISYKETLDTIIKMNIHNIHNKIKNEINNIVDKNEKNNRDNIQTNNKWSKPIKLYLYELLILDPTSLAKSLSDSIFSIFDLNNSNVILNNDNNYNTDELDNENDKFKDSNLFEQNIIDDSSFGDDNFSLNISSILPKDKFNNKNKLNNLIKKEYESFLNKNNIKEKEAKYEKGTCIEILLNNIISILFSMKTLSINNISKDSLIIYLSYFLKSFYYQNIIESKMKFINNDYKYIKKETKKKLNNLKKDLDKYNNNKNGLNERINNNKEQIEIIENKKEISNDNDNNIIKLTTDEKNYLKLCKNGNKLLMQKSKLNELIQNYKIKIKKEEEEINDEINKIKNEIDIIQNKINNIDMNIKKEKTKAKDEIIEYKKIISEKYSIIKRIFSSFKDKHGNNISIYNKLLDSINETLIHNNRSSSYIKIGKNEKRCSNSISLKHIINFNNEKSEKSKSNIELINIGLNLSHIEKISLSKIKESKNKNKSHKKSNSLKSSQHKDSSTTSFFNRPKINKKDYNNFYNSIYSIHGSNKDLILINTELSKNKNYTNENNNINIFLKKNVDKIKILNLNDNTQRPFIPKKSKNTIQNNNIVYNNNIYLTGNLNDIFNKNNLSYKSLLKFQKENPKISTDRKMIKAKSLTNFYNNKIKNKRSSLKVIQKNDLISSSIFYKKINYSLTNDTFCYYRQNTQENNSKLNPLKIISSEIICEPPYNFIPCTISFNGNFSRLKIIQDKTGIENTFSIYEIENTVVSSLIKLIVDIHRKFNKMNGNENDKKEIIDYFLEEFVNKEKNNYPKLSREDLKKCAINNYYDFSIIINSGIRIEFIMTSYNDFKTWINGLAFIIKNKNKIISTIENNIY